MINRQKSYFTYTICLLGFLIGTAQSTWQDLTATADSLQLRFNFQEALDYREKAIVAAVLTKKDTVPYLKLLRDMSKNEVDIKEVPLRKQAYKDLQKQIVELEKFNAKPERLFQAYRRLYIFAGNYMRNMVDTDAYIGKSIENHLKCQAIDSSTLLKTMHSSGVVSRMVGRLDAAVNTFKEAEDFYGHLKNKDTSLLGSIYLDLAKVYSPKQLNIPSKELEYLKKSETIFTSIENPNMDYLVGVYMNLSQSEDDKGNFDVSVGYLKKGLQLFQENREKVDKDRMGSIGVKRELQFHSFLIQNYWRQDNENLMLYHLDKVLELKSNYKLDKEEMSFIPMSYLLVARYYNERSNDKALTYIEEGLKVNNSEQLRNLKPEFEIEKSRAFINQAKYDEAQLLLSKLDSLKNLSGSIKKNILKYNVVLNIKAGNKEKAYGYINKAIHDFSEENIGKDFRTITYEDFTPSLALNDSQRLLSFAETLEEAESKDDNAVHQLYVLAQKQFEANFSHEFLNNIHEKSFSKICKYFYNKASENVLTGVEQKRFLNFTELIESKYLLNQFLSNRSVSNQSEIDDLINQEQKIRSTITYLKKKNIRLKSDSLKQLIFEENLKLDKIKDDIQFGDFNLAQLINSNDALQKIESLKDTHIIKFKVVNDELFRIYFSNKKVSFKKVENYVGLKAKVKTIISQLKDISIPVDKIKTNASELYKLLFDDSDILSIENIYIIPDDILYYLPFEILVADSKYLIEQTNISYATSLSFVGSPIGKKAKYKNIALFAPSYKSFAPSNVQLAVRGEPYYLEGTLAEVKSISELFENSDLYIEDKASKELFKDVADKYSILHLSMHSFINDEDSELSSLVFSDNDKDYELYISELYGLNLNADMVVLSACNTGVGTIETGKGIVSMNTAFTAAGVPSVLSSLWSAPDEATQQLMTSFYKNLKLGYNKSKALQLAKKEYIKTTDEAVLKHPFYWAGFVVSGDVSPIESKKSPAVWIALGSVLLGLMAVGLYQKKKKQVA